MSLSQMKTDLTTAEKTLAQLEGKTTADAARVTEIEAEIGDHGFDPDDIETKAESLTTDAKAATDAALAQVTALREKATPSD